MPQAVAARHHEASIDLPRRPLRKGRPPESNSTLLRPSCHESRPAKVRRSGGSNCRRPPTYGGEHGK